MDSLLLNRNTTRRVDKVAASLAGMVDRVDGGQEQLLLDVG